MINSRQRAKLRALANDIDTILQVGKGGITPNLIKQADEALAARELIKGRVLENAGLTPLEAARQIAEKTSGEQVTVIGSRFVIYRENKENKKIFLD